MLNIGAVSKNTHICLASQLIADHSEPEEASTSSNHILRLFGELLCGILLEFKMITRYSIMGNFLRLGDAMVPLKVVGYDIALYT